ncbi:hypothetical protein HZA39_02645, partial [Candidatus Peregrinibacteria bacterium]|nr:hypothetical protein [Candidatus Peregrinibacteria bacterium]
MLIRERERSRAGTTLIEVIVALFVVGITIVGSTVIVSSAFTTVRSMKNRLLASNFAYEGITAVEAIATT